MADTDINIIAKKGADGAMGATGLSGKPGDKGTDGKGPEATGHMWRQRR